MALVRFFFATSLLLLLSHTIVSATDYGYYAPNQEQEAPVNIPKPNLDQLKPKDYNDVPTTDFHNIPKPEDLSTPNLPKDYTDVPKSNVPKLEEDLPKPNFPKPEDLPKPSLDQLKPKDYADVPKPDLKNVPKPEDIPKPDLDQLKPKDYTDVPKPDLKNVPKFEDLLNPNLDQLKPKDYIDVPKPDLNKNIPKPEDLPKPNPSGYIPKPKLDLDKLKPNLDKPQSYGVVPKQELGKVPKLVDTEKPLPICVEGLVLCKAGPKFTPIEGAVARITCYAVDENGYETAPLAIYSPATDAKGYFFATLPASKLAADKLKLTECKAFIDNSPSQNCKVPTDINNGMSGALLDSFRILKDKHVKLYRVQPFVYTPEATPNGY